MSCIKLRLALDMKHATIFFFNVILSKFASGRTVSVKSREHNNFALAVKANDRIENKKDFCKPNLLTIYTSHYLLPGSLM